MTILKTSSVVEKNKEAVVLCWMYKKMWEDIDISKSLENTITHYSEDLYLEKDISRNDIRKFYHNYLIKISNFKEFEKMLEYDRGRCCGTDKLKRNYIKNHHDKFETYFDMYTEFIQNIFNPYIERYGLLGQ